MTPASYNFDEHKDIQLTTTDTTYTLPAETYYLENDTLFAKVPMQLDKRTSANQKVNIPVEKIEMIEVEKTDVALSVLATIGVLAAVFGIIILIVLGSSGWL